MDTVNKLAEKQQFQFTSDTLAARIRRKSSLDGGIQYAANGLIIVPICTSPTVHSESIQPTVVSIQWWLLVRMAALICMNPMVAFTRRDRTVALIGFHSYTNS